MGPNIFLDIFLSVINDFRFIDSCSTHASLASVFVYNANCKVVPLLNKERMAVYLNPQNAFMAHPGAALSLPHPYMVTELSPVWFPLQPTRVGAL
jgi:hypothetical protein